MQATYQELTALMAETHSHDAPDDNAAATRRARDLRQDHSTVEINRYGDTIRRSVTFRAFAGGWSVVCGPAPRALRSTSADDVRAYLVSLGAYAPAEGVEILADDGGGILVHRVHTGSKVSTVSYVRVNDPFGTVKHCNIMQGGF